MEHCRSFDVKGWPHHGQKSQGRRAGRAGVAELKQKQDLESEKKYQIDENKMVWEERRRKGGSRAGSERGGEGIPPREFRIEG